MWACPLCFFAAYLVHPRLPHHSPHPAATYALRPRIHARPVRRQAPAGGPLPQAPDLVASSHGYRNDIKGGHRGV